MNIIGGGGGIWHGDGPSPEDTANRLGAAKRAGRRAAHARGMGQLTGALVEAIERSQGVEVRMNQIVWVPAPP